MAYGKDLKIKDALMTVYHDTLDAPLESIGNYLADNEECFKWSREGRKKLVSLDQTKILEELLRSYLESGTEQNKNAELNKTLLFVYDAEKAKGYNPSYQISHYLMTGDPSYITAAARPQIEGRRCDIIEEILKDYLER